MLIIGHIETKGSYKSGVSGPQVFKKISVSAKLLQHNTAI